MVPHLTCKRHAAERTEDGFTEAMDRWADFEPWYGDVGAAYDSRDGHVYAFGQCTAVKDKEITDLSLRPWSRG